MSWIVSVFFPLPDVVRTLSPTVCARLVNTILAFESVKPSTSAHKQLSPHSSELPSSLSLGLPRLFRHKVLDLFGSRDGESLAWLRSSRANGRKILLIHGDNVRVESCFDSKNISKVTLNDFNHYDIVISSSPLYSSPDDELFGASIED